MPLTILNNFSNGEIAPENQGAFGSPAYTTGLKTCTNFIPDINGSISMPAGTLFLGGADVYKSRLVPFYFNNEQEYMLEFGDEKIRILQDDAFLEDGGDIIEVASPYRISGLYNDVALLTFAQSNDVLYIASSRFNLYKFTRESALVFTLTEVEIQDGPYLPFVAGDDSIAVTISARGGDGVTVESGSPIFADAEVGQHFRIGFRNPLDFSDIQWGWGIIASVVSNTEITLDVKKGLGFELASNPLFEQGKTWWGEKVTLTASVSWDLGTKLLTFAADASSSAYVSQLISLKKDLKYSIYVYCTHLDPGALASIRAGSTFNGNEYGENLSIVPGDNALIFTPDENWAYISFGITPFSGTCTAIISTISCVAYTEVSTDWRLGVFKEVSGYYPNSVAFFNGRLALGGCTAYPQTLWLSKTADYENFGFSTPVVDTDSISVAFDSADANPIRWLLPFQNKLLCGTAGGMWSLSGTGGVLSPTSLEVRRENNFNCAGIPPVAGNGFAFIVNSALQSIYLSRYSYEADSFLGFDITAMAKHLFRFGELRSLAIGKIKGGNVLWVISSTALYGFVFSDDFSFKAWFRRNLQITGGSGNAPVTSVAVNSAGVLYLNANTEVLRIYEHEDNATDSYYLDRGLRSLTPVDKVVSGLDHLEGEEVTVFAGGNKETHTVESGAITLDKEVIAVHVGRSIEAIMETFALQEVFLYKTLAKIMVQVYNSKGGYVTAGGTTADLRYGDEATAGLPVLLSGVLELELADTPAREKSIVIGQSANPFPLTITALGVEWT